MIKIFTLAGLISLVCFSCAFLHYKHYHLTIYFHSPKSKNKIETHTIYATTDSAAYAEATVTFYLAFHTYDRVEPETKLYISKPISYTLIDQNGNNIDSVLGAAKTNIMKKNIAEAIN